MPTFSDPFDGSSLLPANWTPGDPGFYGVPVVAGGFVKVSTTHGALAADTVSMFGGDFTIDALIEFSSSVPASNISVVFGGVINAFYGFGIVEVIAGANFTDDPSPGGLTGRYVLRLQADVGSGNATATIFPEGSPGSPVGTAVTALDAGALAAMASNTALVTLSANDDVIQTLAIDSINVTAVTITTPAPVIGVLDGFVIQLTPLIRNDTQLDPGSFLIPTQFSDVGVHHTLNGFKTAEVTLDMTDPVVADLQPWEFALRILYQDRLEPVFHGPCNIVDNYKTGKCILSAQDPSFRLLHHYLRRGDDALTGVPEADKGTIFCDYTGMTFVVAAALNTVDQDTRSDPSLGLYVYTSGKISADHSDLPIIVERGQECWQVVTNISKHTLGPDFDMETSLDSLGMYAKLATYDDLGRDLTASITWTYGPELTDVNITPGRATTHAHVLSSDSKYRRTAGSVAGSNKVGPHVDWVPTDLTFPDGDDSALQGKANDIISAYGFCPRFITIQSRPDAVLVDNYGNPDFSLPGGTKPSTFYIGDRVTVVAERGLRSFNGPTRIIEVHLSQPGPRGPVLTSVKLVPTVGDLGDSEES